jgi:hypothetical protein
MPIHHRIVLVLSAVVLAGLGLAACGGDDDGSDATETDDSAEPSQSSGVPTTQDGDGDGDDEGSDGGDSGGAPGSATVTVSAGTFELQLEEACLISDIGIGAVASSDDASLTLAGIEGAVNVGFELSSGDLWIVAAADVVIDGSTLSYSGPASGVDEPDSTISLQVSCDELMSVPGG